MEPSQSSLTSPTMTAPPVSEKLLHEAEELLVSLPKENWFFDGLSQYQGFWYASKFFISTFNFERGLQARNEDIIVASLPKSGTTWLKALVFSIVNRRKYTISNTPLLTSNPHQLVPFVEINFDKEAEFPNIESIPSPRLFGTHIPYLCLPNSIKQTDCKIVYICRNPFDVLVSSWKFFSKIEKNHTVKLSFEEFFELFSRGIHLYGPFWNHMLNFWNESLENPNKVMFLKYEDLKENTIFHVKKLAKFLGFPFSMEEEENGVIDDIIKVCSFQNLKDLEVNVSGKYTDVFKNNLFFRKGEVGDWKNHLNPSMVESLKKIMDDKLGGSGLTFKINS